MSKEFICLFCFVLALALVGDVQAVDVTWTDVSSDHLWSTITNWDSSTLPTSADRALIPMLPGPTIMSEGAVADKIAVGTSSSPAALTVDGGTLTTTHWLILANANGSEGTLNMNSGAITIGDRLAVGYRGLGTLNMTGGTITITNNLLIPERVEGTGHVDLHGGIITTGNLVMRENADSVGTMDIMTGTLIIDGDNLSTVQGYIDNGWITAYGSDYGRLHLDYDVTNEGKTTLKATHLLNPNPTDGSTVPVSVNQLQWTLPEPNLPGGVVTCDVYFGTNPDVEANPKVVIRQAVESVSVTLASNTNYYWAFDLYDSSVSDTEPIHLSPIFTFNTLNTTPVVNAGDDISTWLDNGQRIVPLDGVVSDEDGGPGPATLAWTLIAEPNELNPAQISDPLVANPTVTIKELGTYTLQLEASDGEFTATDTMQIVLYADACEHAKNQEGFVLLPGDINEDCIVNEPDLTILEEHWLQWNYSTE
ncbi:MAG TPA: hypothetical protein VMX36_05145 [Sedimentisphaerales bacterium]|nr:hypothetical protein [Sedimentisphaerales bacterium]